MYKPLQRIDADLLQDLVKDHPDKELVQYIVNGFRNGFHLGLQQHPPPRPPCKNGAKVLEDPEGAQNLVDEEVQKGHILGPFDTPPWTIWSSLLSTWSQNPTEKSG